MPVVLHGRKNGIESENPILSTHFVPIWERFLYLGNVFIFQVMSRLFFLANPKLKVTSINMIVRHKGNRYKKSTGVSIETKYWNADRQLSSVTQQYREGVLINHKLTEWKNAVEDLLFNIESRHIKVTDSDHFWELVDCEKEGRPYDQLSRNPVYFTDYWGNVFIPKFAGIMSESRVGRFRRILDIVLEYEQDRDIHLKFADVDVEFYRRFKQWCTDVKKYSVNYFGTLVKIVRQVMREADIVDNLHDDKSYENFVITKKEADTVYLSIEELKKIHRTPLDEVFIKQIYPLASPCSVQNIKLSYNVAKNRFLIGAFTGLRCKEFNRLSKENFKDNRIVMYPTKTDDEKVVIPIHPVIREIIDSGFDLSLALSEQKTRDYMKIICRYVGINDLVEVRDKTFRKGPSEMREKWELIGTHTARRSFATNAYLSKEIPVISIMKLTGHRSEREFMKYIRISKEENADLIENTRFFSK